MKDSFRIKEIEKLIRFCKNNGITTFEYGGLKFSMDRTANLSMTPAPRARGSAKRAQAITDLEDLKSQADLADDIASTMALEDPVGFENALILGELGEEKNNIGT